MILRVISYSPSYLNFEIILCTISVTEKNLNFTAKDIRNLNIEMWGKNFQGHLSPLMDEFWDVSVVTGESVQN